MINYSSEELRKKGKKELINIAEELIRNNDNLKKAEREKGDKIISMEEEIKQLKLDLTKREVDWKEAGNLADYAAKVNQILESTQKTADMYLDNIKRVNVNKEQEAQSIVIKAQQKADEIMDKVQKEAEQIKTSSAVVLEHLKTNVDKSLKELEDRFQVEAGE